MTTPQSIREIQAQIDALEAEKAKVLHAEKQSVIEQMRGNIKLYGIEASDLFSVPKKKKTATSSSSETVPKYKGPNGEPWAGGLGRKPAWVAKILSEGGNIEDYRI